MSSVEFPLIKGSLISYFSNLIKMHGGINLAQGIPGFKPPAALISELEKTIKLGSHQYAPGTGNIKLLSYLNDSYKTAENKSKVLITNGATEAISLIYNYLMSCNGNSDFNVAAFSPAYESYIHLPKIFGHKFHTFPIDDEVYFDEEKFTSFFEENTINLLIITSPGNPYGKIIPQNKLEFLYKLAEKHKAFVILDSVYDQLYFAEKNIEFSPNIPSPSVFYVNSFSKKFSITGWRVGYMMMHESHYEQMCYTHDYIGLCAPAPLQEALANFVDTPAATDYIKQIRESIAQNYKITVEFLSQHGYYCPKCDGGYFVWCRLPVKYDNSLRFGLDLYEKTKTAIIPGVHFGVEWNNYIRINVARPMQELIQGLESLGA